MPLTLEDQQKILSPDGLTGRWEITGEKQSSNFDPAQKN